MDNLFIDYLVFLGSFWMIVVMKFELN